MGKEAPGPVTSHVMDSGGRTRGGVTIHSHKTADNFSSLIRFHFSPLRLRLQYT